MSWLGLSGGAPISLVIPSSRQSGISGVLLWRGLGLLVSVLSTYYTVRYMREAFLDQDEEKRDAEKQKEVTLSKLAQEHGDDRFLDLETTSHENIILQQVILPSDIDVDFSSIGGLDDIIVGVKDNVVLPLRRPELFAHSNLLTPPKGVLFYGPPGTGKTMMAKAIAKEATAVFINMKSSNMMNKWYGESNKIVSALFSLARKLSPCIIFIDEIDAFLRTRSDGDHDATAAMKAEFMTHWDGLQSGKEVVVVLGATNRPNDIDEAFLRRMPRKFKVSLPDYNSRIGILRTVLRGENVSDDFDFAKVARFVDGFSGSDLKETCRESLMAPVRAYLKSEGEIQSGNPELRPLTTVDVLQAAHEMKKSMRTATIADIADVLRAPRP